MTKQPAQFVTCSRALIQMNKQPSISQPEKLYLTHWRHWYQIQKPELFDLASFEIFIKKNAGILMDSGVIAFIRGDHFVVTPDFDRYVATTINFGLLRALLRSRSPLPMGAQ